MDVWTWDVEAELEKAKRQNRFFPPTKETVFISGDEGRRSYEWHLTQCRGVIALCELLNIQVAGLGIYGSCPVVFVDVRPSSIKGVPKKWGVIYEYTHFPKDMPKRIYYTSDFDIRVWGIVAKKNSEISDWSIEI